MEGYNMKKINTTVQTDESRYAAAVLKYNSARSQLLLSIVFTVVNIAIEMGGAGLYFIFSLSFPYYTFSPTSPVLMAIAIAAFAFYVFMHVFSKKNTGCMVAAMVAFVLDCVFLLGMIAITSLGINAGLAEGEVSVGSYLLSMAIDVIAHGVILYYLIRGVTNRKMYAEVIEEKVRFDEEGNLITEAAEFTDLSAETVPSETASDEWTLNSGSDGDAKSE